ncbi:MAG: glycerol-3-phosphate dehydrogenase/oxidase [Elusimicrobiota bacterium]
MKRDPGALARKVYDVAVVGGGVYGAALAWEAASRGLSVALVDKGDFGGRTSANTLKIIHGGLRYLQQADFPRMRQSIQERRALLRIAPHLVRPLPCLMPVHEDAGPGRELLALALKINDLIAYDRNEGITDPERRLPAGRMVSAEECRRLLPGVREDRLAGGALWYDGVMPHPGRLTLAFLRSACEAGAQIANYVEVKNFLRDDSRITGVVAQDLLTGEPLAIQARLVINAAGPWINRLLGLLRGYRKKPKFPFTKAMNLVIRRPLVENCAAAVSRPGGPVLFLVPWRGATLAGTCHMPYAGDPDLSGPAEREILDFLLEVNRAMPGAGLRREDVSFVYSGQLPGCEQPAESGRVSLMKHYKILDHGSEDGIEGLMSVVGVKYTTARSVAEKAVDQAFRKLEKTPPPSFTSATPLHGGSVGRFSPYVAGLIARRPAGLDDASLERLASLYGSGHAEVLECLDEKEPGPPARRLLAAEVRHAVRNEMAVKLSDAVMRRLELGTAGDPGGDLEFCAAVMARELGWTQVKQRREIDECRALFPAKYEIVRKSEAPSLADHLILQSSVERLERAT